MADENIIIKITGDADLSDAQLQMRKLQDEIKQAQKGMKELDEEERKAIQNIKNSSAAYEKKAEAIEQVKDAYDKYRKNVQDAINENEKSIQSLKKSVSAYNAMTGAGGKAMTRIRELRESLIQMEMAGDTTSQTFIDMSVEAAKLQNQMGDTARQIQVLSSDTKNLDAMVDVASGITGAFSATTSAIALLTDENDALQEAFLKVQAAMSVLNGIQQVANTLNKDSVASVVLKNLWLKLTTKSTNENTTAQVSNTVATNAGTVATNLFTKATKAATTAAKNFFNVLKSNPLMAILTTIAAVGVGIYAAIEYFGEAGRAEREYEKATEDLEKSQSELAATLSKVSKERTEALNQIAQAEHEYNKEAEKNSYSELARTKKSIEFAKQREDAEKASLEEQLKLEQDFHKKLEKERETAQKAYDTDKDNKDKYEALQKAEKEEQDHLAAMSDISNKLATIDEERLKREKEYKNLIIELKKEERDMKISLMEEGSKKEIEEVNARYDDEKKVIIQKYGANNTLIKGLEEKRLKDIDEINKKYINERAKLLDEYNVLKAEIESAENPFDKNLDMAVVKAKAMAEINDLERQITEVTAKGGDNVAQIVTNLSEQITLKRKQLANDLAKIAQEEIEESTSLENTKLEREIFNNEKLLESDKLTKDEREKLYEENNKKRLQQIDNEINALKKAHDAGVISEEVYVKKLLALEKQRYEEESQYQEESENRQKLSYQEKMDIAIAALQTLGQIADEIFGAVQDHIAAEMEALDEMYTTDAQEAKENSQKKYISEKELEDKKNALKRKQAAIDKASAIFSIGMNTAMGIMSIWADPTAVWAMKVALTAMVAATGAVQLATAAAKPLPQYAKGRKGGAGEYALVGEKGPELMYIPQGASIVPNNKLDRPDTWGEYGIPKLQVPEMPNIDKQIALQMVLGTMIDYNRLGKAVADNIKIPQQNAVSVNIDRNGISVTSKGETHTYLNKKYEAQWN